MAGSSQVNGRPLDPTSRRSPAGEIVISPEVPGSGGATSLPDLTDVSNSVTPGKGSILVGDGSLYQEETAGPDGTFLAYDSSTTTGVAQVDHRTLRHLVHFIDDGPACGFASGAVRETLPAGSPFPTSEVWWTDGTKTKKIVELAIVRTGVFPTTETWRMYAQDGTTVLCTVVDSISYSGPFETGRTRSIT